MTHSSRQIRALQRAGPRSWIRRPSGLMICRRRWPGLNAAEQAIYTVVGSAAIIGAILRHASRQQAEWIIRNRLHANGMTYTVRLRGTAETWNPAGDFRNWGAFGPGTAVYTRENSPDGDLVHLEITPKGWPKTGGPVRTYSGPVPVLRDRNSALSPPERRRRRIIVVALATLVVLALAGSGLGIVLTSEDSGSTRVTAAIGGFLGGCMLFSLLQLATFVALAIRRTLQEQTRRPDS